VYKSTILENNKALLYIIRSAKITNYLQKTKELYGPSNTMGAKCEKQGKSEEF